MSDFDSAFMLICWLIWKERNARIFQHVSKLPEQLAEDIREEIAVFFLEKGFFFYPTSTTNCIYTAIEIGNLAPQTTQSEIRSYGDLNSGFWGTTQVTATTRLYAGHCNYCMESGWDLFPIWRVITVDRSRGFALAIFFSFSFVLSWTGDLSRTGTTS